MSAWGGIAASRAHRQRSHALRRHSQRTQAWNEEPSTRLLSLNRRSFRMDELLLADRVAPAAIGEVGVADVEGLTSAV